MSKQKKARGVWPGNEFWKQSKALRKGFIVSFRGLRNWERNHPEEAKVVQERFNAERQTS